MEIRSGPKLLAVLLATSFTAAASGWWWQARSTPEPGSLAPLFKDLELRSGDVVFRRGRSLVSRSVLALDRGALFSHVGLLRVSGGRARVIHALPEGDDGSGGSIQIEPLDQFLATGRASAAAIYRLRSRSSVAEEAAAAAYGYLLAAVPFDDSFNASDDRALYCTELIWAAYREAGVDLVGSDFVELRTALRSGSYIFPSTLMKSRWLEELRTVARDRPL